MTAILWKNLWWSQFCLDTSETTVGGNDTNAYCVEECQPGPDPDGVMEGTWCITEDGWGRCIGDASKYNVKVK